jgi:hypothetical protein
MINKLPKIGKPKVTLSTVLLPISINEMKYETCVFYADKESEVLKRYATRIEAHVGHIKHAKNLGMI